MTAPEAPPVAEVAEEEPEEEPQPSGRAGFMVWLASGVGTISAVVVIAAGTVVALLALFAIKPTVAVVDPVTAKGTIGPMVTQQLNMAANCPAYRPNGGAALVNLKFDIVAGWPQNVVVESSNSGTPDYDGCLVQAVQAMVFGGAPDGPVRLPVEIK